MIRFLNKILAGIRRVIRIAAVALYCLVAVYTSLLTGCAGLMLTKVPPMTKELGYKVPLQYKGYTFVFVNEAAYTWEAEKLNFWRIAMDFVNKPAIAIHDQAVNWLNIGLSAGMFGGGPVAIAMALKKVPKGAVKKEDHDKEVQEALMKEPPKE